MESTSKTLHDFELTDLDGNQISLSIYSGKPVLLLNVATLWGTTVADFEAMNRIVVSMPEVAVVGVFCNQFGHQTNEDNSQIISTLKHVRPGHGFEPLADLYGKLHVNGADAHPLFKWMRSTIRIPQDPEGDSKGNGCDDIDALILPRSGFNGTTSAIWSPVTRNDIAWNFEKFVFDKNGKLVHRYSRYYRTEGIAVDLQILL